MKSTASIMASLPTPDELAHSARGAARPRPAAAVPRLPDCDTMLAPPGSGRSSVKPVAYSLWCEEMTPMQLGPTSAMSYFSAVRDHLVLHGPALRPDLGEARPTPPRPPARPCGRTRR